MAAGYYESAHLIAVGAYDESISGSVAGFSDAMALPLLGSMLIGVVVASDLENRTVHDRLLAASRSALGAHARIHRPDEHIHEHVAQRRMDRQGR